MRRRCAAASLLLSCGLCFAGARGEPRPQVDWPQWRGPERNGISQESGWRHQTLQAGLEVAWQAKVGQGFSSVAIRGDALYTLGNIRGEDTLWCLNPETGKERWRFTYSCEPGGYPGPRATPAVQGERVYSLSRDGRVFCVGAADGVEVWRSDLVEAVGAQAPEWGFAGSLLVSGELVFANVNLHGVCLDSSTGDVVWSSPPGVSGYAAPVLATIEGEPGLVIFGFQAIYGVDVADGNMLWSHPWRTSPEVNAADPLVFDDHVFISSDYGEGCALLRITDSTVSEVWRSKVFRSQFSSFVYFDGYIYGNDGDANSHRGVFKCVEALTGNLQWSADLGFGSLAMAGDRLLLLTERGDLHVARAAPEGYEELAHLDIYTRGVSWSPPVLCRSRIYCRNLSGDLVCIDVR